MKFINIKIEGIFTFAGLYYHNESKLEIFKRL